MSDSSSSRPVLLTRLVWGLLALTVAGVAWRPGAEWAWDPVLRVDGLTQVMALVILFVSGIVHSFSRRYMAGSDRLGAFYGRLFTLTLVVLALTAANHLALFALLWTGMGWLLAGLIGHVRAWPQAQAAARLARRSFLAGSAVLAVLLTGLGVVTGAQTIDGVLAAVDTLSPLQAAGAAGGLLLVAMIQSALVPFHRWLLSSMTAPTPVSAFMHAGLVNAGGVLLARFAPVVFAVDTIPLLIVVVGGLSALFGQLWMLVQTDVKRQLGSSTVAQMGFMVLQCGLGFIPAAIAHLILHGFYKAYFFLDSGSAAASNRPAPASSDESSGPARGIVAVASGLLGGWAFAALTGKSLTSPDSGFFLVVFVVLAVLHATQTMLDRTRLSAGRRLVAVPLLVLVALSLYAAVYNGVGVLLTGVPAMVAPTDFTVLHSVVALVFVVAYVGLEAGWHRSSLRLYAFLRDSSQPHASTLLTRRSDYHVH